MTFREEHFRNWIAASGWLIAVALLIAGAVSHFQRRPGRFEVRASIAGLAFALPESRPLETRISEVPWRPFRTAVRGASASVELQAVSAAILAENRNQSTPQARHESGVAQLMTGRTREALSNLRAAAERSNAPSAWNDLAAAFHEAALRFDEPQLLGDALAGCDHALALDPNLEEALFNRALVLEHLGLADDARVAWEHYLARDSTSPWAGEARVHRDTLAPWQPFIRILDGEYDRVGADQGRATAQVARDPSGARGAGVMQVLGRWGMAVQRGDDSEAERHLKVARQLGSALARGGGDRMLEQAVETIDRSDGAMRSVLANAHADYQAGLQTFQDNRPGDARIILERSASAFAQARSPMALAARYFAANATYEQGHHDEAESVLERLLATVSPDHPAYRGLILWQLGTCHASRADWGAAITLFEQAESVFDRLGEAGNAAAVRRLLAFVYDRIGNPETAWNYRLAALHGLSGSSNLTLLKTVSSIADAAILRREWHTATSFLNLGADIARRLDDPVQLANTLLMHAVVRDRLGDHSAARADIDAATAATARAKDPAYREFLQAAAMSASAMLSGTPPDEADALLTKAIAFQGDRSDGLNIPGLRLLRARARRRAGNAIGAMADLQRGVQELEQHRQSLPVGEARWGAFHAAEELFDEGVDLALSNDDAETAFRFVEEGRARSLLDSYGRSATVDYRRLATGTIVVEYVALPERLVIFTADASGIRAAAISCPRVTLSGEVEAFNSAVRQGRTDGTQAAALYKRLIEPVAAQMLGATTVVFVPDFVTSTVPFNALRDPSGQYLLERHAIAIASSAATYVGALERRGKPVAPRSALLIPASRAASDSATLTFVQAEIRRIAAHYATAVSVSEDRAQFDELSAHAPDADVIHFAGHALGDERGFEPASIVMGENGRERRVGVAEIARLRLRHNAVVIVAGCGTTRGERRAAEGVISVAHGFLSAGAASVIATLWPIDDDAAARFFPRLHERLAEGEPPAEALRATQLESIRRGDVPPSFWAAIQDIGS